ncbi:uncharacterized protein LOC141613898 [Silene latifolia]|uniref:uncharacterized protein LOC141613898 n=1 Tax=Silene latifolia TaxID=37657 RepID=UPI003D7795AC
MGALYTWNNKQCPADRIYSRLDRFLMNQDWLNDYPDMVAHFLPEGNFDHTPCLVQQDSQEGTRSRPFKYFNMWSQSPNFKEIVQQGWHRDRRSTKMFELVKKLKALKPCPKNLNRAQFLDIKRNAEIALTKLTKIRQSVGVNLSTRVIQQGNICGESHKLLLLAPVTDDEIKQTLFSIPNDKAPGPDGYSSQFFKATWDITGKDFCEAIQDFFRSGKLLKQLNDTNITLIPKVAHPTTVLQFRPIACCQRGLRQGDPLSPLLFTICMEYLTGLLAYTTATMNFKFHPLCKAMKLSSLMFADDLLLFCKRDASGLKMSNGKSNVYFNEVSDALRQEIVHISGCIEGEVVLIKAVYKSLHSYWASIFIIPKAVLAKIEAICRNFLWDGGSEYTGSPTVAWDKIWGGELASSVLFPSLQQEGHTAYAALDWCSNISG